MKFNIIGDYFGSSGYAVHTKNLVRALLRAGANVRCETNLPKNWEYQCNEAELEMLKKEYDPDSVTVMISQPQSWGLALALKPKKFYGFCVWEGDKIPEYWSKSLSDARVDKILVPSNHTKDAILKVVDNVNEKISIIPHGYNPNILYPDPDGHTPFTFLACKGWSQGLHDRGGIQWIIKAFAEEFSKEDEVRMMIKVNTCYNPNIDLVEEAKKIVDMSKDKASLIFVSDNVEEEIMRKIYNEGDVFVSTSMADAFNIPVLEAMGCGLPIISTRFGGQDDFLKPEYTKYIDQGDMVHWSEELVYEETKWFKPNIKQIRQHLRWAFEHQDECKKMGKLALKEAENWTWDKTAEKLINLSKK